MKIIVGSRNNVKVDAVRETIYPGLLCNNIFTGIPGKTERFINNMV